MRRIHTLLIYSIIVISCNQSSETTTIQSNSTDSTQKASTQTNQEKEQSPLFAAQIQPSQSLIANEIMRLVSNEYPKQSVDCHCGEDKNCYSRELLTTHYFRENSTEKAIVVIGNSCDEAAHAESGWCDVAIFSWKATNWQLDKLHKEVGGGGTSGSSGDIGDIFQIGEEALGIEIGLGDVSFGALYEGVNILVYNNGAVKSVTNIQTLVDNSGAGDEFVVCNCVQYEFNPNIMNGQGIYALELQLFDCTGRSSDICDGEWKRSATITLNKDDIYKIPSDFEIF